MNKIIKFSMYITGQIEVEEESEPSSTSTTTTKVPITSSTTTSTTSTTKNPPVSTTTSTSTTIITSDVLDLDKFLEGKSGVVWMPDNVKLVRSKGYTKPGNVTVLIGNQLTPSYENWDVTPTQIFDLAGCPEFAVVGIAFLTPENRPICTGFPDKELFGWNKDTVQTGKFAWINGPEVKDKERVTFGLCRFGYSSNSEGRIYLIGKNLFHNGFNFTQVKNPYRGNLFTILQNIKQHNPIIEFPQSHYYSPTRIKCRIKVENGIAKIISNNTYDQILTWVGYNNSNQRSIILFEKCIFDINNHNVVDLKNLRLGEMSPMRPNGFIDTTSFYSDIDLNPLDNLEGYGKIKTKQIDPTMVKRQNEDGSTWDDRRSNWIYTFEPNSLPTSKRIPNGEFDAYIVYKGNSMFQTLLTEYTVFGTGYWDLDVFTMSQGYGWSWYNQEMSGYIENFHGTGYFRNSGGSGITQGLTIKNSTFEQNPPIATSNNPIPQEAQDYINYLESL